MPSTAPPQSAGMQLYDRQNRRLYINADERTRFVAALANAPDDVRSFCGVLLYTGCRISEALSLTPALVRLSARRISFRTLKRRQCHVVREVPLPAFFAAELEQIFSISTRPFSEDPLWRRDGHPVTRNLGYRWVKAVMAQADISGAQACPKGLRHGYGIHAVLSGVQLHMLSRWMGHASIETTAIYATAMGVEELAIADRMWAIDVNNQPLSAPPQNDG